MIFAAASALLAATFALGVLVQGGIVDTRPCRWLHHALFFAVVASAVLAAIEGFWLDAPYRWTLLPALVVFAAMPRVRAGTAGHAALAVAAVALYAAGFIISR